MTNSPCNVLKFPIQNLFFVVPISHERNISTRHSRGNILLTISQLTNFHTLFEAASWQFASETARVQPRKPTPKRNLQRTSKHKIKKKVLRGCHFQVISGNTPQMKETAWQRTSKYESNVQSPPQTTTWQLATHLKLQNAPQTTLPTALPTCSGSKDPGRERSETGNPKNKSVKVEKQPETSKTANQS